MSQANPTQVELDAYCMDYLTNGGNQSAAWRVAFPKSKAGDKVVNEKASTLHQVGKVKERLAELQEVAEEKAVEAFSVDADWLIAQHISVYKLAKRNGYDAQGNNKAENLPAANAALSNIADLIGAKQAQKLDHLSSDGSMSPNLTPEQRRTLDGALGNDF